MFKLLSSTPAGHPATPLSPATLAQNGTPSKRQDSKKGSPLARTFKKLKEVVIRTRPNEKPKDSQANKGLVSLSRSSPWPSLDGPTLDHRKPPTPVTDGRTSTLNPAY
ncbi:hypothetical protein M407DRAFT_29772 [Tulasnella calospora MUT 4182]|uniref:Uncharacterized protein n=1 Tax=Tulasnella calospora MUT 4182 TaxID=1051891 RepID=A0A0C3KGJ6_9AGAM|nr:hypothetical protein M407DRAFT_29772 [Tulasnella calospora MUT 4182]